MNDVYKKLSIYYLSGTGNSYRASRWIAEAASERGIAAETISVEEPPAGNETTESGRILYGFMFPTHGFTAPWQMIKFALEFPRNKGADAFAVATRAGLKFGRIYFPGFEGTALYLIILILFLKGFRIRGAMGLDMPSNWTALHPGLNKGSVEGIISRAKPKTEKFAEHILDGGTDFRGFLFLIGGIILSPVSFLYLILGRFILAKLFFANEKCNGCRICEKNCPNHAIKMKGSENLRPYWTFKCESCMRCMSYCPENAVEAGHSWAVIIYFITAVGASSFFIPEILKLLPTNNSLIVFSFEYVYYITSTFIAYFVFSWLNANVPLINALFSYTTFTRVYRRYSEPDTKLRDLRNR